MNPGKKILDTFVVSDMGYKYQNKKIQEMTWFFSLKGTKSTPIFII